MPFRLPPDQGYPNNQYRQGPAIVNKRIQGVLLQVVQQEANAQETADCRHDEAEREEDQVSMSNCADFQSSVDFPQALLIQHRQ